MKSVIFGIALLIAFFLLGPGAWREWQWLRTDIRKRLRRLGEKP
jgi:hypothetical protein